jgi:hypothetical protein
MKASELRGKSSEELQTVRTLLSEKARTTA